jgi:hypothetical protein
VARSPDSDGPDFLPRHRPSGNSIAGAPGNDIACFSM